jgi:hypothetical protein
MVDVEAPLFENEDGRKLFYVGASRAKHYLDVFFAGGDEALSALAKSVGANADGKKPLKTIAFGLNVAPKI